MQLGPDIVALSVGVIALMQLSVWMREREPDMFWSALASSACVVTTLCEGPLVAIYAIRAVTILAFTGFLGLTGPRRVTAVAVLCLPLLIAGGAVVLGQAPTGAGALIPFAWADVGMTLLCVASILGQRTRTPLLLVLAPVAGPILGFLDHWSGSQLTHIFAGTVIVFGAVTLVVALLRKADEQSRAQAATARISSFYAALSATSKAIVRVKEADALYAEICRICVHSGHAVLACVYLDHGDHLTRPASAGRATALLERVPDPWPLDDPAAHTSYTVQAIRQAKRIVCQDYLADPRSAAWREAASASEVRSIAWLPLRRNGRCTGVLMLGAAQPGFFDEALVALLDEMAEDISFGLDNIDRDAAHAAAEREVQAGLERFQRLFQAAPVSAAIISIAERRVIDANVAMCQQHQAAREDLVGRITSSLQYRAEPEDSARFYETLAASGHVRNMTLSMRDALGCPRLHLVNAEPIDYQGEACHLFMSVDITDLRAAETARAQMLRAQAESRAKTQFLSRMSHELRTPLNAVIGFSELLRQGAETRFGAVESAQLEQIHRAGEHLLELVNDGLDLSRIEAGGLKVEKVPLDLLEVIKQTVEMTRHLAEPRAVTLHVDFEALQRPAIALADPTRIRQCLLNVLSNAVKYNRPGGRVCVSLRHQGEQLITEVRDTGLGMSQQQLEHLFEPFNRLGRDEEGYEGVGIGLSLTRDLMHLMDGEISVTSEPDRGTTFSLVLASTDDCSAARTPITAEGENGNPTGRILYIEDNPVNVLLVEQMLAQWKGVTLNCAPNGSLGLRMATTLAPDVVLLDMQLPDMDGLEVLRQLNRGSDGRRMPVVVLSATADPEDIERMQANGAAAYWTKPLRFGAFLQGMAALLRDA